MNQVAAWLTIGLSLAHCELRTGTGKKGEDAENAYIHLKKSDQINFKSKYTKELSLFSSPFSSLFNIFVYVCRCLHYISTHLMMIRERSGGCLPQTIFLKVFFNFFLSNFTLSLKMD